MFLIQVRKDLVNLEALQWAEVPLDETNRERIKIIKKIIIFQRCIFLSNKNLNRKGCFAIKRLIYYEETLKEENKNRKSSDLII